jgi:hypothetical protein
MKLVGRLLSYGPKSFGDLNARPDWRTVVAASQRPVLLDMMLLSLGKL